MSDDLEPFSERALRQLEQEDKDRAAKLRDLQNETLTLEAEERAAAGRILRAQQPLQGKTMCERCWIWDGATVGMRMLPGTNDTDLFKCPDCGHEVEAPL